MSIHPNFWGLSFQYFSSLPTGGNIVCSLQQYKKKIRSEEAMQKVFGMMLLVIGASTFAMGSVAAVPEIGVGSAGSAVALLSGTLLVIRGRRKK
jgi:hypothetical protein